MKKLVVWFTTISTYFPERFTAPSSSENTSAEPSDAEVKEEAKAAKPKAKAAKEKAADKEEKEAKPKAKAAKKA